MQNRELKVYETGIIVPKGTSPQREPLQKYTPVLNVHFLVFKEQCVSIGTSKK